MKVGIIGYKGFVGSAFYDLLSDDKKYEAIGIGKEEYPRHVGEHFDLIINANGNSSKVLAQKEPKKDFEMNAAATLASLLDFTCDAYVYISSIEVYGNGQTSQKASSEVTIIEPEKLSNYGFSKFAGELLVKKYAKKWLILRLGGMVGANMRKGPAFDILNLRKLFISSKSRFQFINTLDVASICKLLVERGRWQETYNVVGRGNLELSEVAKAANVSLCSEGSNVINFDVSTEKLREEVEVPTTRETIEKFLK